jgi:SprT-like family protein
MTQKTLRWYARRYYKKYWGKSLPKECHVRFEKLQRGYLGVTTFVGHPPIFVVSISNEIKNWDRTVRLTLLHELCHVALSVKIEHGPKFQLEMLRIANLGAFMGLW